MIDLAGTIKLLLIDDDEDDYFFLKELIEDISSPKVKLQWISKYSEAQEALRTAEYDISLIDYRLGEGTGLDLIREAITAKVDVPLVLMTGFGHHDVDMEAMRVGAADYLVKDQITAPLLERTIRYAISRAASLRAVRQEKENFRDLFNSTFEGIFIHAKGTTLDLNDSAARIFGYSREELLGKDLRTLLSSATAIEAEKTTVEQRSVSFEGVGFRKDGSKIDLEWSAKEYRYGEREAQFVTVRDVTSKKQMEAQLLVQDRLASLGLMASSLAHEIGTPLGIMRGRAELLGNMLPNNEVATKNLGIIISQIDRVSTLIRSLLTLARGGEEQKLGAVVVQDVVRPVLEFLSHEFATKGIQVETELLEQSPLVVVAEANSLQQVILNLLVNAVHAIEYDKANGREKHHKIRISGQPLQNMVQLSIKDTGTGISSENMRNLFKPFFTTKDIGKGTGLGLATSYRLLESWGGSIEVLSEEGAGATFKLLLKAPQK